jgi:hypothetical protein
MQVDAVFALNGALALGRLCGGERISLHCTGGKFFCATFLLRLTASALSPTIGSRPPVNNISSPSINNIFSFFLILSKNHYMMSIVKKCIDNMSQHAF